MTTDTTVVEQSRRQRAIARAMSASWQVPQFSVEVAMDAGSWFGAGSVRPRGGPGLVDHLAVGVATVVADHPLVNSSLVDDAVHLHRAVNVGIAIDVDGEIMTPTVRDVASRGLAGTCRERRRVTADALAGTLAAQDAFSATFTISNLGPMGITRFTSLVVPPQVCSLAVGAPDARGVIALTLSADHRVVNGAPAARFLSDLARCVEASLDAATSTEVSA